MKRIEKGGILKGYNVKLEFVGIYIDTVIYNIFLSI